MGHGPRPPCGFHRAVFTDAAGAISHEWVATAGEALDHGIGQQVLGRKEGATAFDNLTFQTRPFYTGNPWFLAPSVLYYRWRDRSGT